MDFQNQVFELIEEFTGQKNILTIPVAFIKYTGSRDAALFLSQLIYWTGKSKNKDGWIYKTYSEWEEELYMSEYEIRKARKTLEKLGILETKIKKANGNPTVHYRLKKDIFSETFLKKLQKRTCKNSRNEPLKTTETLTEITTETTTEITTYTPCSEILKLYNEICTSLPRAIKLTDNRKKAIKARWKEYGCNIEIFKQLFEKAEQSDFLTKRKPNNRNWRADFDWLMNQQNMAKVLEDKYANEKKKEEPYPYQGQLDPEILKLYTKSGD